MTTRRQFLGVLAGVAAVAVLPEPILRRAYQRFGGAEGAEQRITAAIAEAARQSHAVVTIPRGWLPYDPQVSFASSVRLIRTDPETDPW